MKIDQLMYYDKPIDRLLIIYQESNKVLNSVDKELKSILSNPDNINIDKLKDIKDKMNNIDLSKIDELLKKKSKESKNHKEKLSSKLFNQTSKIKNLQKNSYNCMKEQKDFISTFVSINNTLLSFVESIDKEKQKDKEIDEYVKEIIQISKIQSKYMSKYNYSIKITEKLFKESYLTLRKIEMSTAAGSGFTAGYVTAPTTKTVIVHQ